MSLLLIWSKKFWSENLKVDLFVWSYTYIFLKDALAILEPKSSDPDLLYKDVTKLRIKVLEIEML